MSTGTTLSVDQVAEFLLRNHYLLTGLELYQETVERGQESARLKALFTPQKLDDVTSSEDAAAWASAQAAMRPARGAASKSNSGEHSSTELANRVALLEYELRQERQTTQELRAELSKLLVTKDALPPNQQTDASAYRKLKPASSIEARLLNYVIKKHLVAQGYKLTAISLSSESGQELNHWSAVSENFGVSRPEPPSLVNLYRYFYGAINNAEDQKAIYAALETSSQVIAKLRNDLADQERRTANANQVIAQLEDRLKGGKGTSSQGMGNSASSQAVNAKNAKEADEAEKARRLAEDKVVAAQREAQIAAELASAKEQAKKRLPTRIRDYSFLFTRDESELDDGARRISSEIVKLRGLQSETNDTHATTIVLGDTLPEIVPGVILKKREELIPAIVATVCWHPEERKRQEMTYMLFNLIRIPNPHQRSVIIDGCVQLAYLAGEERTGTELLPLAVEGISSPYEERRILSADACGWLSPNVQHEMRLSLLLSILQQLSQDRSPVVRTSACLNLARILVLEDSDKNAVFHSNASNAQKSGNSGEKSGIEEGDSQTEAAAQAVQVVPPKLTIDPKKYTQLCEMVLALLQDPDATVLQVARTTLMPVFGDFIERLQLLESKYLPSLLTRMKGLIGAKGVVDQKKAHEFDVHSEALVYLAPVLYENALLQSDFYAEVTKGFRGPKYASGSKYVKSVSAFTEEEKRVLADRFAQYLEDTPAEQFLNPVTTPKEDWTVTDWILQDFIPNVIQIAISLDSDNLTVINALCNTISTFTQEFGETFTRKVMAPHFEKKLKELQGQVKARSRIAILYFVSVITGLDEKDVAMSIRQFILDISMTQNGWSPEHFQTLQTAIQLLLEQFDDHKETVLSTMSELILHEDARVRRMLIQLYNTLLTVVATSDVTGRILPSLITMANDSDINVRCDVIATLGELAIMIQDNNTTGRITAQLESFITDSPKFKTIQQLIRTYGKILPSITPGFRDSFVLKQLGRLCKYTLEDEDTKRQKELAETLYDAYRALNGMSIGRDALRNHVIPGLKLLQKTGEALPQDKRTVLSNMISVMEQYTSGSSSGGSSASSATTPGRKSLERDSNPTPASNPTGAPASSSSGFTSFFSGWGSSAN
jgi:hypothetical protein